MTRWKALLCLFVIGLMFQGCIPHFWLQEKKEIVVERAPVLSKPVLSTQDNSLEPMKQKLKALEQATVTCNEQIEDLQNSIEKLQNENMTLAQAAATLKSDLDKKDRILALQSNVIQLLDDPQKTIENGLQKQIMAENLTNYQVKSQEQAIKFVFWNQIMFAPGKTELSLNGQAILKRLAKDLSGRYKDCCIAVEGHTDNRKLGKDSSFETNWELSAARAITVVRFLQEEANVAPERLSACSFAQFRPVASNDTPEERRKNRRIEIFLSQNR